MRTIEVTEQTKAIPLGIRGENYATKIRLDCTRIKAAIAREDVADAKLYLVAQRKGDAMPYEPSVYETDGNYLEWTITSLDTACAGDGRCEVSAYAGDVLVKTIAWKTVTADSLGEVGDTPDALQSWIDELLGKIAEADTTIDEMVDTVDEAKSIAEQAKSSADDAAEAAQTASDAAQTSANDAEEAKNSATAAQSAAEEAQAKAVTAGENATAAQTAAEEAQKAASAAQTAAQTAAEHAVLYTEQSLTEEEQEQARTNIGALSSSSPSVDGNLTVSGNITTGGHENAIGTVLKTSDLLKTSGFTANLFTNIFSLSLPAGTWVIIGYAEIRTNSNMRAGIYVASQAISAYYTDSYACYPCATAVVTPSSTTTYTVQVYVGASGATVAAGHMYAVRIA